MSNIKDGPLGVVRVRFIHLAKKIKVWRLAGRTRDDERYIDTFNLYFSEEEATDRILDTVEEYETEGLQGPKTSDFDVVAGTLNGLYWNADVEGETLEGLSLERAILLSGYDLGKVTTYITSEGFNDITLEEILTLTGEA